MMTSQELSYGDFISLYKPLMLEEVPNQIKYFSARIGDKSMVRSTYHNRVWTLQKDDEGKFFLISGKKFANCEGYVICELPFEVDGYNEHLIVKLK
jgi:hypothetical protein